MIKDDDFKLLRGLADGMTDGQTNGWTFVNVELLLQLKNPYQNYRQLQVITNKSYDKPK